MSRVICLTCEDGARMPMTLCSACGGDPARRALMDARQQLARSRSIERRAVDALKLVLLAAGGTVRVHGDLLQSFQPENYSLNREDRPGGDTVFWVEKRPDGA